MKKAVKRPHLSAFLRKWWQLIIMVLAFTSAAAQDSARYSPINGYGFRYKRMGFDSVLMVPYYESPHTPYRAGALKYRRSDSSFYKYTGTQWLKVEEGSPSATNGIDTVYTQDDTLQVIETPSETYYTIINSPFTAVLNDSTIVIGSDTLVIIGGAGGGGSGSGTNNTNLGSGFRILVPSSQGLKTLFSDITGTWDSTSNTNGLTYKVDTSVLATQFDLTQVTSGINQLTGDVTAGPGTGSQAATIANNAVTNAKFRQGAALSVVGVTGNSTANVADIAAATDNQVLRRSGTSLAFGAVNLASSNAVSGLLPEDNLQAFKQWPAERQWRTIYEKSSWPDLADFSTTGTAVISLSTGYVNVTASTQDYTPRVYFKPEWATGLNYWKTTTRVKILSFGSPSNWMGPFIKSLVTHDGANFGYQFFTSVTSAGTGNSFFTTENGTIISNPGAGSGVTKSLNDVLEFVMERADTTLTFTLRNITTSTTATPITYTFSATNAPHILPNVGQWGILLNAASGSFQIQYVKIESSEIIAPNILVMGNSKTANGVTTFNRRYPTQLNATYPTVTWSAGTAERMDPDMFYKRPELTFRNPEYVLLGSVYDNDKRAAFSNADIIDDMIRLENYWKGGGATVLWMCFPEDSTAGGANGLTGIRNWLVANRPNNYINTWDSLRTSGSDNRLADIYDNGDGVHLNAAAHDKIVQTIIASGLVSTISANRRVQIRTDDPNLRVIGDSVGLAFDWSRTAGNIPRINSSWNATSSNIWDNGTNVVISTSNQPTPPHASSLLSVNGLYSLYGSTAAQRTYGRTVSTDFFETYHNLSTLYLGFNGTDGAAFGTRAQLRIGTMTGISNSVMPAQFQIRGTVPNANSAPGFDGFITRLDTNVINYTGAGTALGNMAGNSFGDLLFTATNVSSGDTITNGIVRGAPRDGTNFTSGTKLGWYFRSGQVVFNDKVSFRNVPTGQGAYTILVKNGTADSSAGQVPASTFATQSALNDTASAIRSVISTPTPSYEMFYSDNSTTTVGNTTTEATLLGTGTGTAQFTGVTAGSVLSLKGSGILSTAGSAGVPTLEFTISNYTAAHNLTGLSNSLTNVPFDYDFEIIPVGIGSSQDALVNYTIRVADGASGKTYAFSTRVTGSFTSSGTLSVDVTADWDAADAANTLTSYKNIVQIFRK